MAQAADDQKTEVRYVLVTGASSGIGEAIAQAFVAYNNELLAAKKGYRFCVIGTGRNKEKLEKLASELNKDCKDSNSPNFISVVFDLGNIAELQKSFWPEIEKYTKYFHIIINNAGLGVMGGLLVSPTEELLTMINVNMVALTLICQEGLIRMKKHMAANDDTQGFIINISSIAGHSVTRGASGPYCATKHYVRALTEGLRKEVAEKGMLGKDDNNRLAQNIHIGMISPGVVKTGFLNVAMKGNQKAIDAFLEKTTYLVPKDIADATLFMVKQPAHANVCDMIVRPRLQAM